MSLKCGIIGLPNVGKSTLFNALTASNIAEAANYPFCTIEPNSAIVTVPDKRLVKLSEIAGSAKLIPAYIEFVDIAGLVKGASTGEGLGNKFLSHIREVDAIVHVVRCFEDSDISHVYDSVDPIRDIEIIETELMLADMESVEKRIINAEKKLKSGDKNLVAILDLLKAISKILAEGKPARTLEKIYGKSEIASLQLLSSKPILYICNVLENEAILGNKYSELVINRAQEEGANSIVISSKIEADISSLENEEEKNEFLATIGLTESGLVKVIRNAYDLLDLKSFFTIGPKEAHAWTFKNGTNAQQAAGIIHTDFAKGFIRAEVISYSDYLQYNGEVGSKEVGKMRLEGKEYTMQDGDIVHFRFNV